MIYPVFAIRDAKSGFGSLLIETNEATAKRNFAYALQNGVQRYAAKDFDLYRIGEYNSESGEFKQDGLPDFVIAGEDAVHMYG